MMDFNYDLNDVETTGGELIPPGTYPAVIEEIELVRFNSGSSGAKLVVTITDGPFASRKVFENLVLVPADGSAPKPAALARAKQLLEATGGDASRLTPQTLMATQNSRVNVKVGTKPASNGYEASNKVNAFLASNSAAAGATGGVQAGATGAAAPAPAASQQSRPWG